MTRERRGSVMERRGSMMRHDSSSPPPRTASSRSPRAVTNNVQVMVRVRPFNKREIELSRDQGEELKCVVEMDGKVTSVLEDDFAGVKAGCDFEYDSCFWSIPEETCQDFPMSSNGFATQEDVYEVTGKVALANAWESYNTCIFAYGQTGSGKSYSMLGDSSGPHMGISPRIVENLFKHIEEEKVNKPKTIYKVEVTFLEIYNEQVKDLFAKNKNNDYAAVKIRQHPIYGVFVDGLQTKVVQTSDTCKKEMEHGIGQRALASTKMNATSSRSHAIFQIHIHTSQTDTKSKGHATINLVDLAGSERISKTGATGQTADEAKSINLSLSTLRKVIDVLIENSKGAKKVPPYRESMLTWVLKDSLGGNSKTMMICTISPHDDNKEDTISTLRYGLKAKAIVNRAIKQEVAVDKQARELKAQIHELEEKLRLAQEQGVSSEEAQELQEQLEVERQQFTQAQEDLAEMQEREQELKFEVIKSKKQKFASAFRSAFVLEKEKKQLKVLIEEKEHLQEETARLQETFKKINTDMEEKDVLLGATIKNFESIKREKEHQKQQLESAMGDVSRIKAEQESNTQTSRQMMQQIGIPIAPMGGEVTADNMKREVVSKFEQMKSEIEQSEQNLRECERRMSGMKQDEATLRRDLQQVTINLEAEREEKIRGDELSRMEVQNIREKAEFEINHLRDQLQETRRDAAKMQTENLRLQQATTSELDELRRLVKSLQAELYVAEETITETMHRKDRYKKQCLLLREMHEADTRIIKTLGGERCVSGDVLAVAAKISNGERGEKITKLQPVLEEKAETIQNLTGALGDYQDAAAEWMTSPNVVGAGSRQKREERARSKLTVWLRDSSISPSRSNRKTAKETLSAFETWQGSPFGVRDSSPPPARRGSSIGASRRHRR
eukprot:TRINITY_DN2167_c0_g1_i1.p1 TRINITY_DN2167_c0_g1~~TRINITY_DN2167_c0_g1_i1.p1  ORF type:complete len:900 (+),score=230.04 TRINITY_DN2167_c0_g1_i1:46-2745(+)